MKQIIITLLLMFLSRIQKTADFLGILISCSSYVLLDEKRWKLVLLKFGISIIWYVICRIIRKKHVMSIYRHKQSTRVSNTCADIDDDRKKIKVKSIIINEVSIYTTSEGQEHIVIKRISIKLQQLG